MPNVATVLKDEITRLARKELKQQIDPLRTQIVAQRKAIAALKLELSQLQRGVGRLSKNVTKSARSEADSDQVAKPTRYSSALLRKLRERLGLSRDSFAPLIGASPQAVYNWERTDTRPRQEFLDKIALIRSLSKVEVQALLEQHSPAKPAKKSTKSVSKKRAEVKVRPKNK